MTNLTDDEFTVLSIAGTGKSMIPIGRWKKPVEDLVAKGFLYRQDQNNNTITNAGREALDSKENEDAHALIGASNAIASGAKRVRDMAEMAAHQLAAIARVSHSVAGDAPADAARKWSEIILNRALELLR